jgi:hypothetical protein
LADDNGVDWRADDTGITACRPSGQMVWKITFVGASRFSIASTRLSSRSNFEFIAASPLTADRLIETQAGPRSAPAARQCVFVNERVYVAVLKLITNSNFVGRSIGMFMTHDEPSA